MTDPIYWPAGDVFTIKANTEESHGPEYTPPSPGDLETFTLEVDGKNLRVFCRIDEVYFDQGVEHIVLTTLGAPQ